MDGVNFLVDESGHKTAVLIDLRIHGSLWEDFHDVLLAESRKDEPRESLASVKARLKRSGKIKKNA